MSYSFRVDNNASLQLAAGAASACLISNQTLINQVRKGKLLVVPFLHSPWGHVRACLDQNRSNNVIDDLKKLISVRLSNPVLRYNSRER
jgi:hypothetical protein